MGITQEKALEMMKKLAAMEGAQEMIGASDEEMQALRGILDKGPVGSRLEIATNIGTLYAQAVDTWCGTEDNTVQNIEIGLVAKDGTGFPMCMVEYIDYLKKLSFGTYNVSQKVQHDDKWAAVVELYNR